MTKHSKKAPPTVEQVRDATLRRLKEREHAFAIGAPLPSLYATDIAKELGTSPYHVRKVMKLVPRHGAERLKWGAGRPRTLEPVTAVQLRWLCSREVL